MKVLVVGGGTSGLISAIILRKHLDISIDLVHSKNIGIIGVGEGSTEHFYEFMKFVGIKDSQIIKECGATYKSGIMFKDWSELDYLHNVGAPFNSKFAQYNYVYGSLIGDANFNLNSKFHWINAINRDFLNSDQAPFNQYHFDTFKLNSFLTTFAKNMGINIIEDEIKNVSLKENGEIESVFGEKFNYKYDFYIDCTGFKRLLIGKTDAKWVSYKKYLKMNSAVVFPTEEQEEFNLWTESLAMNFGWKFTIPVQGRTGNGYVFDNNYIDVNEAKKEIENIYKKEIDFGKEFTFDPGALDKPWVKNCVAIGLSGSFFEPLEATSIGTTIQQSFLLMHRLVNYNEETINSYNKACNDIFENIRDFLFLHYITKKNTSIFWRDVQKLDFPETLAVNLKKWKNKLPIKEDFNSLSSYVLFNDANFIVVMSGLNLFNRTKIREEYETHNKNVFYLTSAVMQELEYFETNKVYIGHKNYINLIKNYF